MSSEQKVLASILKEVHSSLRKLTTQIGAEKAWQEHCKNTDVLQKYASCMEKLATTHWVENFANHSCEATSRIQWAAHFCYDYFINKSHLQFQEKEMNIAKKINVATNYREQDNSVPIKLIDVGSCYNPFRVYDFLDVLAIDLCPANNYVFRCDFLNVPLDLNTLVEDSNVKTLAKCSFDAVTFCFLLEYIPTSELRIKACQKAYDILKPGGLLIINTPDSKHVGSNYKLMKCWRFTLASVGFIRIKYQKHKHMHCMAFRKAIIKSIAVRWAMLCKEPYMEYCMHIPQDFNNSDESHYLIQKVTASTEDFAQLPFSDIQDS